MLKFKILTRTHLGFEKINLNPLKIKLQLNQIRLIKGGVGVGTQNLIFVFIFYFKFFYICFFNYIKIKNFNPNLSGFKKINLNPLKTRLQLNQTRPITGRGRDENPK